MTLRDPKVSTLLNRHFIPVVVDIDKPPPELIPLLQKVDGQTLPFLLCVSDRGQYMSGTSGRRDAAQLKGDLDKTLQDKQFALTKAGEAELTKQVAALEKVLDDKAYAKVPPIWQAIGRVRGYGPLKEKAYDLLDAAQEEAKKELLEALKESIGKDFAAAKKRATAVSKAYAGLPIADEAKQHAAALTLMEPVTKLLADKKGNYKAAATQQLDLLLKLHGDTPYASISVLMKKELQK